MIRGALVLVLLYRAAYQAVYLAVVPFAQATFSDGALYERAARDLLAHPPFGSEPFYLQGAYAYLLAAGLSLGGSMIGGLFAQSALALSALLAGGWALARAFGRDAGLLGVLALCAYFPLSFYGNKYLSASLGVSALMLVWAAFAWYANTQGTARAQQLASLAVGITAAWAALARPNLVLAIPCAGLAVWLVGRSGRRKHVLIAALGVLLGLLPMMLRNAAVTGSPSVFPSHGGGTSFYIGNNPHADGRWNNAGGLLSGQVAHERRELLRALDLPLRDERTDVAAIGAALYQRAFAYVRAEPGAFLRLELKKLWLTLGSDELTQDYDALGERELMGHVFDWGLPFAFLLSQGFMGAVTLAGRRREATNAAWLALLGGQFGAVLLANVLYFTSSQHRLPLAVIAAAFVGIDLQTLVTRVSRGSAAAPLPPTWAIVLAGALCLQAFIPRETRHAPSIAHYYNLSLVEAQIGNLPGAALALDRALRRRPEDPVLLIEQAGLMRRLGQFALALGLLDRVRAKAVLPDWVRGRERIERALVEQQNTEPFVPPAATAPG